MDDMLVLTKEDWTYHVQKLESTLNKLKKKGLKCNIEGALFVKTEIEYLVFCVTCAVC